MRDHKLFSEAIAAYTPKAQMPLTQLRKLVHETALVLPEVGEVTEALRWKQFSFVTEKGGSTFRIDGKRDDPQKVAVFFHCQSGLIDEFKTYYSNTLKFEGKRAIILDVNEKLPEAKLRHCISLALTQQLREFPASRRKTKSA